MEDKGLIVLAAGGTGGHLFPAEALGHELKARGYRVHLVTDSRAERFAGKFPADEIHVVPSATIASKNPVALAKALLKLWSGMRAARRLFDRIKPKAVIGFGGYPTVPPLLASTTMKIPSARFPRPGHCRRLPAGGAGEPCGKDRCDRQSRPPRRHHRVRHALSRLDR
jgi:UDP-N-acetylglucosamine--N-acetylmuramyl-(pentapeptide) pyrophosphoryl-undecaprenol N-acetylglucosamine transferase